MSIVVFDAFERENLISGLTEAALSNHQTDSRIFKLKDMNIKPCRSCGGCGYKSPGKCIIDDDIHELMRAFARCSVLIFLTPIRFGGYSSLLKKAVDKMMPMGTPFYEVKNGHLLHPMRYGHKLLLGIGLAEKEIEGQEKNFRLLIDRNALNMQFSQKTLIVNKTEEPEVVKKKILDMIEEVREYEC